MLPQWEQLGFSGGIRVGGNKKGLDRETSDGPLFLESSQHDGSKDNKKDPHCLGERAFTDGTFQETINILKSVSCSQI